MIPASPPALLHIDRLKKVYLEFTTRCNLRCVYCGVTQPYHAERDMNLSEFDSLVDELKQLGVRVVQISGAGETTVVKGWDGYLYRLQDAGFQVSIITNLAKPLTDGAVRALSRCIEVSTSCDTVNPGLFAAIRSGGDLRLFLRNIQRIRSVCLAEQRQPPRLIWNMVANDRVIFDVEEWVVTGIGAGVDHFQISDMTKLPDVPGTFCVNPIGNLTLENLARARAAVERARALAQSAQKFFTVLPFVEEVLAGNRKSAYGAFDIAADQDGKPAIAAGKRSVLLPDGTDLYGSEAPGASPGLTRNCILPWTEAFFWASNAVAPCCMYKNVSVFHGKGVLEAVNSPGFVEIREGLLTGALRHECNVCPMFELVDPELLQRRVSALTV